MGRSAMSEGEKSWWKARTVALVDSINAWVDELDADHSKRPRELEKRYPKLREQPITLAWRATLLLDDVGQVDVPTPTDRFRWNSYAHGEVENRMSYERMRLVAERAVRHFGWDRGEFWYLLDERYATADPIALDHKWHAGEDARHELDQAHESLAQLQLRGSIRLLMRAHRYSDAQLDRLVSRTVAEVKRADEAEDEQLFKAYRKLQADSGK